MLVAQRGREEEIARVFRKWGLEVATIGEVHPRPARAEIRHRGKVAAEMPIAPLTDDAPVYERPVAEPADLARRQQAPEIPPVDESDRRPSSALLATPELASKEWIWRQYDHTVRTNTVQRPGRRRGGAACSRGRRPGSRMTSDVNPVYCGLDPRRGGMQAVAEAVRNLACVGAEPVGAHRLPQLRQPREPGDPLAVPRGGARHLRGLPRAATCRSISGNVSLYNETDGRSIHADADGGDGRRDRQSGRDRRWRTSASAGDRIVLLGARSLPSSAARSTCACSTASSRGRPPAVDLDAEARLGAAAARRRSPAGLVHTAHDLSEGGLAVALAESHRVRRRASARRLGARAARSPPRDLFSETQARALVAGRAGAARAAARARRRRSACRRWRSARWAASDLRHRGRRRARSPRRSRGCTRSGRRRCRRRSGSERQPRRTERTDHVRHLRHRQGTTTRRTSPTSASTRCSTAARRAPASAPGTASGCTSSAAWGTWRRSSRTRCSRACRGGGRSATRATRPPARR